MSDSVGGIEVMLLECINHFLHFLYSTHQCCTWRTTSKRADFASHRPSALLGDWLPVLIDGGPQAVCSLIAQPKERRTIMKRTALVLTVAVVDRLEGGKKNLEDSGYKFASLVTRDDLLE